MIQHPASLIFIASILLVISKNISKFFFSVVAAICPLLTFVFLFKAPESIEVSIYNITLLASFTSLYKLIGASLILVLFFANIYALGQEKYNEIILGNIYGGFCLICLFSSDYLSLFISLEIMMVASAAIIFIGGMRASLRAAKGYFITHLSSSQMILLGIVHVVSNNDSLELVSGNEMLNNAQYSSFAAYCILTGLIMNIAAFPFSGWMVKHYPKASPSGFLYLICFTTKVSLALIIKLFSGLVLLKYIGIVIIAYGFLKVLFEDNIFASLCYLSIMVMGFILMGVSTGFEEIITYSIYYLCIHILYKLLLSIIFASIMDESGNVNYSNIKVTNNINIKFAFFIAFIMLIGLPATLAFDLKHYIAHEFVSSISYIFIILLSIASVYALPYKKFWVNDDFSNDGVSIYTNLSVGLCTFVLILICIFSNEILQLLGLREAKLVSIADASIIKQFTIIVATLVFGYFYQTRRVYTNPINLVEWLGGIVLYLHSVYVRNSDQKEISREPWSIDKLERQVTRKLSAMHNQNTAIFILFAFFIVMLVVFLRAV